MNGFGALCLALFLAPVALRVLHSWARYVFGRRPVVEVVTEYTPTTDSVRGRGPMAIKRRIVRQRSASARGQWR